MVPIEASCPVCHGTRKSQSLLNQVNGSDCWNDILEWANENWSQSLLNQVNGSDEENVSEIHNRNSVAIPSKSGQWFR